MLQLGISFNEDGPVFDEAGATNVAGLYLIGDLVVGKKGGSIITAFNCGESDEERLHPRLALPAQVIVIINSDDGG